MLEHERLLSPGMAACFHRAKNVGFASVLQDIRIATERVTDHATASDELSNNEWQFVMVLGTLLFERLPANLWSRYFPFSGVRVDLGYPHANTIRVLFQFMEQRRTPDGTAYYSEYRPTVGINGNTEAVAFYRHAAERICERCICNWKSFGGLGDAFALLHDCIYYEPWINELGEPGFTFYDECSKGFLSELYVSQILGTWEPGRKYYYRIGYCPAAEFGELLVAKTLLLPGMRGTPEFAWARRNLTTAQRADLDHSAAEFGRHGLASGGDLSFLKRFHEGEIRQVVAFDHVVFRTPQ